MNIGRRTLTNWLNGSLTEVPHDRNLGAIERVLQFDPLEVLYPREDGAWVSPAEREVPAIPGQELEERRRVTG